VLEAAPGVQTRWAKAAIARIVTPPEPAADAETIDVTDAQSSNPTTGRPE
jgi:preprotein translocase subunit YajC